MCVHIRENLHDKEETKYDDTFHGANDNEHNQKKIVIVNHEFYIKHRGKNTAKDNYKWLVIVKKIWLTRSFKIWDPLRHVNAWIFRINVYQCGRSGAKRKLQADTVTSLINTQTDGTKRHKNINEEIIFTALDWLRNKPILEQYSYFEWRDHEEIQ